MNIITNLYILLKISKIYSIYLQYLRLLHGRFLNVYEYCIVYMNI